MSCFLDGSLYARVLVLHDHEQAMEAIATLVADRVISRYLLLFSFHDSFLVVLLVRGHALLFLLLLFPSSAYRPGEILYQPNEYASCNS